VVVVRGVAFGPPQSAPLYFLFRDDTTLIGGGGVGGRIWWYNPPWVVFCGGASPSLTFLPIKANNSCLSAGSFTEFFGSGFWNLYCSGLAL
jgi:hypothetical protein